MKGKKKKKKLSVCIKFVLPGFLWANLNSSTFNFKKKKSCFFFLLKFQLICSYVFNFVLILYMYVPLVWCLNFIRICVFLLSKRITVFFDILFTNILLQKSSPLLFSSFPCCFWLNQLRLSFVKSVSSQTAAKHWKKAAAAACLFLRGDGEQSCCQQSVKSTANRSAWILLQQKLRRLRCSRIRDDRAVVNGKEKWGTFLPQKKNSDILRLI